MSSRLLQSTMVVSVMTLLSRILGFVRDMVIAVVFGATGLTDAFIVAFRIPNMFRRMSGEGAFSQAFVPVFSEYKTTKTKTDVKDLVDHVSGSLGLILFSITAIGIVFAPFLILIFAPGFSGETDQQQLATQMLRLTFPYVLFISLTAMAAGVLNSFGRFAVPAFTPVLLNLSLIAVALLLAPKLEHPITALAWGVFIAGIVQLVFQFPSLYKLGLLPRPRLNWSHPGVRKIFRLMLPALVGSSAAQINLLINTIIASFLVSGSISWLYYSDRFVELPLAIFGVAIGTVILPRLSTQHGKKSMADFSATIDWAMRLNMLVVLPAMIGLVILGLPILATMIQYGSFTAEDSRMAALSMAAYALGLPAFASVKILAPGFYSRQDTKTPVRFALISIAVNLVLNVLILIPWIWQKWPAGHAVLALSAAVAANVNAILLYRKLVELGVYQPGKYWYSYWKKIIPALLLMIAILVLLLPDSGIWSSWSVGQRVLQLGILIFAGGVSYLGLLLLLGMRLSDFKLARTRQ